MNEDKQTECSKVKLNTDTIAEETTDEIGKQTTLNVAKYKYQNLRCNTGITESISLG